MTAVIAAAASYALATSSQAARRVSVVGMERAPRFGGPPPEIAGGGGIPNRGDPCWRRPAGVDVRHL